MADLSTTYMGIRLRSPIVVAACSLSGNVEKVKQAEQAGAGALVIKSLFEEQVQREMAEFEDAMEAGGESFAESLSYFPHIQHGEAREHVMWVREVRKAVAMPLIASVNAINPGKWVDYARQLADTGVDGIELNAYAVEADIGRSAAEIEDNLLRTFAAVKAAVDLPIAVKLSPFYTSVGHVVKRLADAGAAGAVLFNRFLQPEIDPAAEVMRHTAALSHPGELRLPLRWIALLYGRVGLDLAGNTGVGTAADVAKYLLAGAQVVQVASAVLRNGIGYLTTMNKELAQWMDDKAHPALSDVRGRMSLKESPANAVALERAHYLDYVMGKPKK